MTIGIGESLPQAKLKMMTGAGPVQTSTEDLLGHTAFALRDVVLKLGAKTLEAATNERAKKRGTKAAVRRAPAGQRPAL